MKPKTDKTTEFRRLQDVRSYFNDFREIIKLDYETDLEFSREITAQTARLKKKFPEWMKREKADMSWMPTEERGFSIVAKDRRKRG